MSASGRHRAPPRLPLPYRARPPQVLLGVGAVLLVSAGAAVASAYGGRPARLLLLALAAAAGWFSLRAARAGLRSSEETLAACAAGLALSASASGGLLARGDSGSGRRPRRRSSWSCTGSRRPRSPGRWPPGAPPSSRCSAGPGRGPGRAAHRGPTWASPSSGSASRCSDGGSSRRVALRDDGAVVAGRGGRRLVDARGPTPAAERWLSAALVVAAAARAAAWPGCARPLEPLLGPPVAVPGASPGVVAGAAVDRGVLVARHRSR